MATLSTPAMPVVKAQGNQRTHTEDNQIRSAILALYTALGTIDDGNIEDLAARLLAIDVAVALKASATSLDDHIADTADAHDASAISVLDTNSLYIATDVEAALAEVRTELNSVGGNPMLREGVLLRVLYYTAAVSGVPSDGWYYPTTLTVPDFTNRTAPIIWEGTAAQLPANGSGDLNVRVGDMTVERPTGDTL